MLFFFQGDLPCAKTLAMLRYFHPVKLTLTHVFPFRRIILPLRLSLATGFKPPFYMTLLLSTGHISLQEMGIWGKWNLNLMG